MAAWSIAIMVVAAWAAPTLAQDCSKCPPLPCMRAVSCNAQHNNCVYEFDCRVPGDSGEDCCGSDDCVSGLCDEQTGECGYVERCQDTYCCGDGTICKDHNDCTRDVCVDGCCEFQPLESCCGNGTLEGDETCDPPGSEVGSNGALCREDCTYCGDGNVDRNEACDDGNTDDTDDCRSNCTPPTIPGGCRITGGRTGPDGRREAGPFGDMSRGQGGGQVGAPCGCIGCFDEFDRIQGNWQYSRRDKKGNFHAKEFNSLICGCDATSPTCDGSGVVGAGFTNPENFARGELCNPDNSIVGPEPRPSPANIACFSGLGSWSDTNGRKIRTVAFRVEVEDRGEPSVGGNADDTCDVHRIRIWIPVEGEDVNLLADGACCTNSVPAGQAAREPDVDDGGNLTHGNMQIHPMTPNSANGRCPVPDGSCQQ